MKYKLHSNTKTINKNPYVGSRILGFDFHKKDINLYNLEDKIAYGREGGTNFKNTQYHAICLSSYKSDRRRYTTDNCSAELIIGVDVRTFFIDNTFEFEDTTKEDVENRISILVDTYFSNFLDLIQGEIRYSKRANKFWCDDYIFYFNTEDNGKKFTLGIANIYGNYRYVMGWDGAKNLPKKYDVVDKEFMIQHIKDQIEPILDIFKGNLNKICK